VHRAGCARSPHFAGNANAALLYLYFLRSGASVSVTAAAAAVGMTEAEAERAAEHLRSLGLLKPAEGAAPQSMPAPVRIPECPEVTPEYTAEDIKNILGRGGSFDALVRETQKSIGRVLSSDDLIKLFGIYDNLGLPPEVILQLVTYCIGEHRRKYGPGRMPTMRYIEKAAYTWERAGVFSLERAEQYIRELESKHSAVAEIKRALQISDRSLSSSEKRYVESWLSMGFGADAAALAYDRTVVKTGKLAWGYMNSIMNSWHAKGLHTPQEIERGDMHPQAAYRPRPGRAKGAPPAPTASELEDMRRLLDDMKEGR